MTNKTRQILIFSAVAVAVLGAILFFTSRPSESPSMNEAATSAHPEASDEHGEGTIEMTAAERKANGVATAPVEPRALSGEAIVPGEVVLDLYRSAQITPRISAQVVTRHAKLGDNVKKGMSLVTLSSVEMADAQGALIVAGREWKRVRSLGREVVSERRYVEAQVAAEQAHAKVLAFGMTADQVAMLLKEGNASKATGTFDLIAPQDGTVIKDDFVVGEIVEPGRILFQISDESQVWVEAQLTPAQAAHVAVGAPARILLDSDHAISGKIIQSHHRFDETTRTLPIRIEVDNEGDALHPGQFVRAAVKIGKSAPVLAIPGSAVTLMNGSSTVFKVDGAELHPTTIEIGDRRSGWVEVKSGLAPGDEIAVSEIFLLKSLIQKSQMGEGHGH